MCGRYSLYSENKVAEKFDLKLISIEDLVAYRMEHDSLINKKEDFKINTKYGSFRLRAYQQTTNDQIHIALTKGQWHDHDPVLTLDHLRRFGRTCSLFKLFLVLSAKLWP